MGRIMKAPFFPDPAFGWMFYLVLVSITLVAAWIDWKKLIVPKVLAIIMLGAGILFNLVRGAWLGAEGQPGNYFGQTGIGWGLLEGLLFSLAGFAVGFSLFFALWVMKTCGGGDVKLFAAMGAWLGPLWTIYILIGTWFFVAVGYAGFNSVRHFFKHGLKRQKQQVAYSFPVAVSTAIILLWVFRFDLQLAPRTATPQPAPQVHAKK
jgi:Flp pilus assembly protein protease CpaA